MVAIPAGKFLMGSPAAEPGRFDSEGPQHVVQVKAFALGKYDVTSKQFLAFLAATGYQPAPCNKTLNLGWQWAGRGLAYPPSENEPPDWPAVCLDHKDALAFVGWLNAQVKAEHPTLAGRAGPYRLPSEAEWEYAARGGTASRFWWGDDDADAERYAWFKRNANQRTHSEGEKPANPFGLYDVVGNVWQWTQDCYEKNYAGAPRDGRAAEGDMTCLRVDRGGSWGYPTWLLRPAARERNPRDFRDMMLGFRVARTVPVR
jgi:formylglycine-generating enzyme required for sulfatase activity